MSIYISLLKLVATIMVVLICREMILKAKEAGVNAVKFQTFKADKLISAIALAEYQIKKQEN
ncbi:N,N'-diacetyllegionaminic acid synthase [Escherichia coli]|nr:N-acetylneuraminate synthase family protein [Escherichia coli]VCV87981.1 N,N'-diacetyllegionaminic acid synthase [Escherichia coli]